MQAIDEACLRQAIELSRAAREAGNEPYGALLADAQGNVLATARNEQLTTRDCTAHAETALLRDASRRLDRRTLERATLYASGEPCAMCAGAIYWSGVGRVVYALGIDSMVELGGAGADPLSLSCRDVLARGTHRVEVIGPLLEDEARRAFA